MVRQGLESLACSAVAAEEGKAAEVTTGRMGKKRRMVWAEMGLESTPSSIRISEEQLASGFGALHQGRAGGEGLAGGNGLAPQTGL